MKNNTVIDANELFRQIVNMTKPGTYDSEVNVQKYTITYVSDQLIRATNKKGILPTYKEMEINRHTLRLRYLKTGPPEWEFNCAKAERAF